MRLGAARARRRTHRCFSMAWPRGVKRLEGEGRGWHASCFITQSEVLLQCVVVLRLVAATCASAKLLDAHHFVPLSLLVQYSVQSYVGVGRRPIASLNFDAALDELRRTGPAMSGTPWTDGATRRRRSVQNAARLAPFVRINQIYATNIWT